MLRGYVDLRAEPVVVVLFCTAELHSRIWLALFFAVAAAS